MISGIEKISDECIFVPYMALYREKESKNSNLVNQIDLVALSNFHYVHYF